MTDRPADAAPPDPPRFVLGPRALVVVAVLLAAVLVGVVLVGRVGSGGAGAVRVDGAAEIADGAADSGFGSGAGASAKPSSTAAAGVGSGSGPVVVHVAGAVASPGVRRLAGGERVEAAITAAGGARDDADLARVNLARPLVDGEQLYVPRVGETELPVAVGGPAGAAGTAGGAAAGGGAAGAGGVAGVGAGSDGVVDLNTADAAALDALPGIGPAIAARILAWRDEHGRFSAVEDLLDVNGIGDAKFAELRDRVRV